MDATTHDFVKILRCVRAGEPTAIGHFVDIYEPFIRRSIRFTESRSI